jgi:hypothetical protein
LIEYPKVKGHEDENQALDDEIENWRVFKQFYKQTLVDFLRNGWTSVELVSGISFLNLKQAENGSFAVEKSVLIHDKMEVELFVHQKRVILENGRKRVKFGNWSDLLALFEDFGSSLPDSIQVEDELPPLREELAEIAKRLEGLEFQDSETAMKQKVLVNQIGNLGLSPKGRR